MEQHSTSFVHVHITLTYLQLLKCVQQERRLHKDRLTTPFNAATIFICSFMYLFSLLFLCLCNDAFSPTVAAQRPVGDVCEWLFGTAWKEAVGISLKSISAFVWRQKYEHLQLNMRRPAENRTWNFPNKTRSANIPKICTYCTRHA